MRRVQEYFRAVKREEAVVVALLLVILLLVVAIWISYRSITQEEAFGQPTTQKSKTEDEVTPPAPLIKDLAEITVPEPLPKLPKDAFATDRRPRGIPGLSDMDIIGNMQYLPGTNFRCPGGGPVGRGLSKHRCLSSSADDSAVYEVTLVEDDPSTVLWVQATAYDASDDAAADFLAYVARLSLEDVDPINPKTWVDGNISSGGEYLAKGARLKLYGTEGARTLEIVATDLATDEVLESPSQLKSKDGNRDGPSRGTSSQRR